MKQLPLSKLQSLFAAVSAAQKLYIPADDAAGQASFTVWQEGIALTKKLNTVRSAKDLFFPQVENLVGFRVTGRQLDLVETRDPAELFVLFGVRACDARSFEILDRVFLSEPQDTYYAARRAHGTVVTLSCTRPEETCFCPAFGIDPAAPQGDISCWIEDETLFWQANTEKGKALTAKLTPIARSAKTAKKNVKVTVSLDKQDKEIISQLKDAGYTVKYRFYRSTKKAAGYKAAVTKKASIYTSTSGKKGTKYFYKVQVRVYDASGKLAAKTALKQCRYASRTWNK